jgi:hypothetical protein
MARYPLGHTTGTQIIMALKNHQQDMYHRTQGGVGNMAISLSHLSTPSCLVVQSYFYTSLSLNWIGCCEPRGVWGGVNVRYDRVLTSVA